MNYLGMFGEINAPHLLQSEVDRLRAKFPNLTPDSPPVSTDASATPLSELSESVPFVNELSRDEE